jgi:hypothetical protein
VEPAYQKTHWELPGGTVESNEPTGYLADGSLYACFGVGYLDGTRRCTRSRTTPACRNAMTLKGYMQSHHVDYFLGSGMSTPP